MDRSGFLQAQSTKRALTRDAHRIAPLIVLIPGPCQTAQASAILPPLLPGGAVRSNGSANP
jgi:hypothetical protein